MNYMGIDHHRQYLHITLLSEGGEVVKSGRVANLPAELEAFLDGVEGVRAEVEAVWPALRADFDLGAYYDRMKKKKGGAIECTCITSS